MSKKIVIVGGGVAGLSAGIYAQKAGFESEIYEKHVVAGGQCTGWNRKGFYIDNCISWLTNASENYGVWKVWTETDFIKEGMLIRQHDAYYTSELDGKTVTFWTDLDKAQKELLAIAPEDKKEIKRLIKNVRNASIGLQVPYSRPLDKMKALEFAKYGLASIKMIPVLKDYSKLSMGDLAARFKNPLLRKALLDYLPEDYCAFIFVSAYGTIVSGGGGVPEGGSSEAVERMVEKYKSLGGKLYLGKPVAKIETEGKAAKGIILESGEKIAADYVIASPDTYHTFHKLLDESLMPEPLKKAYADNKANPLGSSFQCAFSYDGKGEEFGRRFFYDCSGFNLAGRKITRMNVKNYSAFEPKHAPEGKALIQVKILENENEYLYWENLYKTDKKKYNEEKKNAAKEIERMIYERFPSAKGKLELLDVWSPYTYTRYCNAYRGVYMSFITTKHSKGTFNIPGVIKNLDNVFLAGQWLQLPGGLPVAITTGKFAVQRIMNLEGKGWDI